MIKLNSLKKQLEAKKGLFMYPTKTVFITVALATGSMLAACPDDSKKTTDSPAGGGGETATVGTGGTTALNGNSGNGSGTAGAAGSSNGITLAKVLPDFSCKGKDFDPKCSDSSNPGQVGVGPQFTAAQRSSMAPKGGFIEPDGKVMYVAVSGQSNGRDAGIYRVDLVSGERKVITGDQIENPNAPFKEQKEIKVGSGDDFSAYIFDVKRGPDGVLYVLGNAGFFTVDETTGKRTLISPGSSWSPGAPNNCPDFGNVFLVGGTADDVTLFSDFGTTAGSGFTSYSVKTKQCTFVTTGANGDGTVIPTVGSGPLWNITGLSDIGQQGGFLYGMHGTQAGIWKIAPDGVRTVITKNSDPDKKGTGCLLNGIMAIGPDFIWTTGTPVGTGCGDNANISKVDPTTGDRTSLSITNGPMRRVVRIWVHPTEPDTLIAIAAEGISAIRLEAKDSFYLSR